MTKTVVIAGAGQAGLSCAVKLRELGFDGRIELIGDEPHLPYQRPPLSKGYLLGKVSRDGLTLRPREAFDKLDVALTLGTGVTAIDRDARTVTLADGTTRGYDSLVLATGSRPRTLPEAMGGGLDGVHVLRGIADADRLQGALAAAGHILVVGGGYIGLEMAAVAAGTGHRVTVVEAADRILKRVACAETSALIRAVHGEHGVRILEGVQLARLEGKAGRFARAVLADGSAIEADLAVVGIGGVANTELAEAAGLACRNGVVVDATCRSDDPDIFAAGDCAAFPFGGETVRLESVQNAVDQAIFVARAIMGETASYTPVPWFWSDQYDVKLQTAGHGAGYDAVVVRPGDEKRRQTAVWYLKGGRAVAVDTLNDPRTHMAARRAFAGSTPVTRAMLDDPAFDIAKLALQGSPAPA